MPGTRRPRGGQTWETRYAYDAVSENADQVEWAAVLAGAAHLSAGTADDVMSEAGDDLTWPAARFGDRLQGAEMVQEALQGTVAELLRERAALLGADYPFTLHGNSLVYRPADTPLYELLLGICQAPTLSEGPYCALPRLFETLSQLAGMGYLGPDADGYRTGWPRPEAVSHFQALIADVKQKTGSFAAEWQWSPDEHLPADPAPRFVKEEGLDVVIWRKWPDQRTGQLYLLGQCACGKGWLDKDADLTLEALAHWFKLPRVQPVRSFFTPRYAIAHLLNQMSSTAGLVFDRVRIVQSLRAPHIAPHLAPLAGEIAAALDIAKDRDPVLA